jgi:hypothetical protein
VAVLDAGEDEFEVVAPGHVERESDSPTVSQQLAQEAWNRRVGRNIEQVVPIGCAYSRAPFSRG